MRQIRISDETMKLAAATNGMSITFKQKLELAKLLDGLGVSVMEVEGITKPKADSLRIKSIAMLAKNCTLAVPVQLDGSDVQMVWEALSGAAHPRLQVQAATSPARMEYIHKIKSPDMAQVVAGTVAKCAALTSDVEFIADDATRTDGEYLRQVVTAAIEAGATTVTVGDDAGKMLPDEFAQFVRDLIADIPQLGQDVALGIACSNDLYMAESNAVAAIAQGVDEVKATSYPLGMIALDKIAKILGDKADQCQVTCPIRTTVLNRTVTQIGRICEQGMSKNSLFVGVKSSDGDDIMLSMHDSEQAVAECVAKLGYELSDEDNALVYEAFLRIASKKDSVSGRELDAIVASAALQVPPTYTLVRYTINSGNLIKATACVQIAIGQQMVEEVGMGDGPIDASFAAVDKIVGKSYELDDWQMQSVTQGQEAMGEAVVKLMSDGKVYSGRGISTDIVGSSIRAYLNAINKVVYEEEN